MAAPPLPGLSAASSTAVEPEPEPQERADAGEGSGTEPQLTKAEARRMIAGALLWRS